LCWSFRRCGRGGMFADWMREWLKPDREAALKRALKAGLKSLPPAEAGGKRGAR
jgi:hypothetical protein